MKRRRIKRTLPITLVSLTIAACVALAGFADTINHSTAWAADSSVTQKTFKIDMKNDNYDPDTVTVPIGTTVVWTNRDMMMHSVTSGTSKKPTGLFDSDVAPFATFSYTFRRPGTYPYYCKYHDMNGTIVVTAAGSEAPGSGSGSGTASGSDGSTSTPTNPNQQRSYGQYGSSVDDIAPLGSGSQGEPLLSDGLRLLPYTVQNGYKVFRLAAKPVWWEPTKGNVVEAWGYNGSVPGPEIRVNAGDKVTIIVTNQLPEGTTVHWHGLDVPFAQDGSGGDSQPDIAPGKSQTYTFQVAVPPGTYIYHAHPMNDMLKQEKLGLNGPFIVEPKGTGVRQLPRGYQQEYTLLLNDSPQFGETINGKSYPSTPQLHAKLGNKVLIHVINMGSLDHPLSLDGMHFQQIAQDGYALPAPVSMATIDTQPGTTYDIQVTASNLGKWLLYSPIFEQTISPDGRISGMAIRFNVTK